MFLIPKTGRLSQVGWRNLVTQRGLTSVGDGFSFYDVLLRKHAGLYQ